MQIGVDFGGTKIEVAALDRDGSFLARLRAPNPGHYEEAIDVITDLVSQIERKIGKKGTVGVGTPGSISPSLGTMRNANCVWLNGRWFREDLSTALNRDVRVANDANCLALSEASDGAASGVSVAFAIALGTGCGGGLTVDGKLIEGANGIGGEWGHTPLPWANPSEYDGPLCWCGRKGCLDGWISGTGLARDYQQATGEALGTKQIAAAARRGDPHAIAARERFLDRLGRALALVSNIIDPEIIVLGGGLSNLTEIYDRTPPIVEKYAFTDVWTTKIVPAKWGDSSGVRGAARLWPAARSASAVLRDSAIAAPR